MARLPGERLEAHEAVEHVKRRHLLAAPVHHGRLHSQHPDRDKTTLRRETNMPDAQGMKDMVQNSQAVDIRSKTNRQVTNGC